MTITIRQFPRRVPMHRDDLEATAARIAARQRAAKRLPAAPAVFIGVQSGHGFMPDIEIFNLTTDVSPLLLRGSTVSRETLEKAGFYVPPISPARINQANSERTYGEITA